MVNRLAPEHAELAVRDARALAARITTAGALFLGVHTPEPVGDYIAGPSHVLPTGGSARFASPLGVADFVKRTSIIEYDADALAAQADDIERLTSRRGPARPRARRHDPREERLAGGADMNLAATLRGTTYRFRDLKEVLAKANEEKSGDRLAGRRRRQRRRSASPPSCVLAEVTLAELHENPVVPYEEDAVTRLIHDDLQRPDLRRREVVDGGAAARARARRRAPTARSCCACRAA